MRKKYKYSIVNKLGIIEPWTGTFANLKMAQNWYKKHGVFFEKLGYDLVLS